MLVITGLFRQPPQIASLLRQFSLRSILLGRHPRKFFLMVLHLLRAQIQIKHSVYVQGFSFLLFVPGLLALLKSPKQMVTCVFIHVYNIY